MQRSITVYAQHITSGSEFEGILNGGEDYRELKFLGSNNGIDAGYVAWNWNTLGSLSRACTLNSVTINYDCGGRNNLQPLDNGTFIHYPVKISNVSISGNIISGSFTGIGSTCSESFKGEGWIAQSGTELSNSSRTDLIGYTNVRLGMHIRLDEGNSIARLKFHVKNLRATITYTSAAYVSFVIDGITVRTTKFDDGVVPSYGGTPTKEGHTFTGWQRSSTGQFYSGALPAVGNTDETYTAIFTPNVYDVSFSCTEGGYIVGVSSSTEVFRGTSGTGQVRYSYNLTVTAYPNEGCELDHWLLNGRVVASTPEGKLSFGVFEAGNVVQCVFKTPKPKFKQAAIKYGGVQVTASNKVPTGQYAIISIKVQ